MADEKDLLARIEELEKLTASLKGQFDKLAMALVEYKKAGDPQTKVLVEDLRKQVANVNGRLGINGNPKSKNFQTRAPGPITSVNRPIVRPERGGR
jgi:hypothetical protein